MNFSQPYFTFWDVAMGTYLEPTQFHMNEQERKDACQQGVAAKQTASKSGQSAVEAQAGRAAFSKGRVQQAASEGRSLRSRAEQVVTSQAG
jgi:hypothetical protein